MARVSTFVDRPIGGLPGPRQVTRSMIALVAVGTSEHGTLNLAKGIGTVASLDIGSYFVNYGSAAVHAGPTHRGAIGSFGSVLAHRFVGSVGSFTRTTSGTLAGARNAGSIVRGTLAVPRLPLLQDMRGSLDMSNIGTLDVATKTYGTVLSPRIGSHQAAKIWTGTLAAPRHQLLQNIPGTLTPLKAPALQDARGTLDSPNLGSFPVSKVWTGTLAAPRHQLIQNIPGTLATDQYARAQTVGTWRGAYGSFGTLAGRRLRVDRAVGSVGSFVRTTGATQVVSLGSHLNGSWVGNETRNRYAVWATPFSSPSYRTWFGFDLGSIGSRFNVSQGRAQFLAGATRRSAGSVKYYVARNAGPDPLGTARPFGSLWVFGVQV